MKQFQHWTIENGHYPLTNSCKQKVAK